jgi:hypothetical protein
MPFVTAAVAGFASIGVTVTAFQLVTTVLSVGYQLFQSNKMKKAQAAAAEARKGFEATKQDQIVNLPVVYGRNMLGSVVTDYKTEDNFTYAANSGWTQVDFIKDANNYIQVTVVGDVGQDLDGEGQTGKDIINLTSITTEIVFGGLTINTSVVNSTGRSFRNGVYLSESFEDYRSKISAQDVGDFTYNAGKETRVSNTVYKFKVQRLAVGGIQVFNQGLLADQSGSKNEFLFTQNAIAFGGISKVVDVKVDGKKYGHEDFDTGLKITTFPDGGADALTTANGFPSSNLFTNVFSASCVFKLDRDEPQYSGGIPTVEFFVEGQKTYDIELDTGVYSLSTTKTYSANPARALLDYLTDPVYGRGLSTAQIDLESFYNAKVVCDEVVKSDAITSGLINPANSADIPRYELNAIIDTTGPIRENVNQILESMGQATLIWTGGQYKLNVAYPTSQPSVANGQVDSRHVFTDDEVIMSDFSMNWPNAQDKFNQVTVSFPNSYEDFKTDSVSWPPFSIDPASPYQTYLTEDNNEELRTSVSPIGITNPYHAQAKAEELVRLSRNTYQISVTLSRKAILLEPGDFFIFSSEALNLPEAVYRVESITINSDLSIEISAYYFDYQTLAWNVADDEIYSTSLKSAETPNPITSFGIDALNLDAFDIGKLTWVYADDAGNGNYTYKTAYKVSTDTSYISLATTLNKEIHFQRLEDIDTESVYDFKVSAITPLGEKVSEVFLLSQTLNKAPGAISSTSVSEEIYITARAAGAKSKALLAWVPDHSSIKTFYTLVEYKLTSESVYQSAGTSNTEDMTLFDLKPGDYDIRLTPYSAYDFAGPSELFQATLVGLSAVPTDPAGFSGNINEGQINLSWDLPVDLDVLYGGTCEIRHHPSLDGVASWDTASVLVDSLSGNTNNKTVPTLKGTFFIKLVDSVGNYSVNADVFISTFEDLTFNQIETLDEATPGFLGAKTNCAVSSGNLVLTAGQTTMTYEFDDYLDLGEVVTVRVSPNIVASVASIGTLVEDYADISTLASFLGPLKNASLKVFVSVTQDDPAGSPTWSAYAPLSISSEKCRALRFKFVGTALDTNTNITVTELSITVDKKDIIKVGTSTSSAGGDTTVTFTDPFYGGPGGTNSPSIGTMIIGGNIGDIVHIVSRDKTGFVYSIYATGSSTRLVRNIDFQAIGQ